MLALLTREFKIYSAERDTIIGCIILLAFILFISQQSGYQGIPLASIFIFLITFIASDLLFRSDFKSGFLDQLFILKVSFYYIFLIKTIALFVCVSLPLTFLSWGMQALARETNIEDFVVLLAGSLTAALWASTAASLFLGIKRFKGILMLAVFPFYLPVFLIQNAMERKLVLSLGYDLLGGLLLMTMVTALVAGGYSLKCSLEDSH